jgi:subtilisin-like proprotein convertase family protein
LARSGGRRGRGIVFLWAAGNENCPIAHTATVDVPYTDGWDFRSDGSMVWIGVETARQFRNNLVGIPGLMHVAALASAAKRSHYSNYGTGILICAPTNNVHAYYRLRVPGLGITTTTGPGNNVTDSFGGTSSATPLVAGVAALTISANPDLTALEVVSILKQTASKDLKLEGYARTPAANYDPNPVWDISPIAPFAEGGFQNIGDDDGTWSPWFGHGRVDAAGAVAEALKRRNGPPAQNFQKSSSPNLNIPENDPTGARDRINFAETAIISSLKVEVDITHTYIGDLRVTLIAPSGASVALHDRNGGSANDLQRAFDFTTTPGLSALAGQSLQGDWTLLVQDLAAQDVGKLNRWALEIQAQAAGGIVNLEEAPGVTIPDNNPNGIERTLAAKTAGRLKQIEVAVDITHSYIGDLQVKLVSPAGKSVTLHQRSGGASDNLIKIYTPATTSGLQALTGQTLQGEWKLKVADLERRDVGKLNRWALKIVPEP